MLKAMRTSVGKSAYFNGGRAEEVFTQQLDQTLSQKLAKSTAESIHRTDVQPVHAPTSLRKGKRMQASLETELAALLVDLLATQDDTQRNPHEKTATAGRLGRRRHGGAWRPQEEQLLAALQDCLQRREALLSPGEPGRIRRRQHSGRGEATTPRPGGTPRTGRTRPAPRPTLAAAEPCQLGDRPADLASPFPTPGDYRDRGATPADIWREGPIGGQRRPGGPGRLGKIGNVALRLHPDGRQRLAGKRHRSASGGAEHLQCEHARLYPRRVGVAGRGAAAVWRNNPGDWSPCQGRRRTGRPVPSTATPGGRQQSGRRRQPPGEVIRNWKALSGR